MSSEGHQSIEQAAQSGSERDLLVALRDSIARQLDGGVPPRDMASLSKRLMEIRQEISAIDAEAGGDPVGNAADVEDAPWP